jgi:hypothetical protein
MSVGDGQVRVVKIVRVIIVDRHKGRLERGHDGRDSVVGGGDAVGAMDGAREGGS